MAGASMSEGTQAKLTEQEQDDISLRAMQFRVAFSICEDRNEFVAAYLAALAAKLEMAKPLYEGRAACPSVLGGLQCAAFLVACGQSGLPISDGVQTLREFVDFLDEALVHWR
jgi:hypothetical protein